MHLKVVLADGTELISNEVRENLESDHGKKPIRTLQLNFGKDNTYTMDELAEMFSDREKISSIEVYRRDTVMEDGEEVHGPFEYVDTITGYTHPRGVYKNFFTKQVLVVLETEQ